jgi:hypothetical protein
LRSSGLLRHLVTTAAVASALGASLTGCTSGAGHTASTTTTTTAAQTSASPPDASVEVEANKGQLAVKLKKDAIVHIVLPPIDASNGIAPTFSMAPKGSNALVPVPGFAGYFKGVTDGTVTIAASQSPSCSPGKSCDSAATDIGSVVVTVTG